MMSHPPTFHLSLPVPTVLPLAPRRRWPQRFPTTPLAGQASSHVHLPPARTTLLKASCTSQPPKSSHHPSDVEIIRQSADFHPSVWGDYFISLSPLPPSQLGLLKSRHDELMIEVRKMLKDDMDPLEILEIIDRSQRLGIAYLFEKEINDGMLRIHQTTIDDNNLYEVSLVFRLLRQHRYHVSCDVFNNFLDENDEFKASLRNNVKALLSLYEAAHLKMPGENILDKALNFSKCHLNSLPSDLEPHLAMMVSRALDFPLIRSVDRPRAKQYLSIYEKDTMCGETLLDFAKLDFLLLQASHQDEVRSLSIWWKNLNLAKNLPFTRDRMVECYFWLLTVYFEPNYSHARVMAAKVTILLSLTDDIYDNYGTVEELQLFTDVIQSWKLENIGKLPKYYQHVFFAIYKTYKEFEDELAQDQYSFRVEYLKRETIRISKGYFEGVKWARDNYLPKLEDHLRVTLITAACSVLSCATYVGMKEEITKDFFEWLTSMPQIILASSFNFRVKNDIVSYVREQKGNLVASTVQCYAVEHECSEEEACSELTKMVEEKWNIINREFIYSEVPISLIRIILNLANSIELFCYQNNDGYTHSIKIIKDIIFAVLVEPVRIATKVGATTGGGKIIIP